MRELAASPDRGDLSAISRNLAAQTVQQCHSEGVLTTHHGIGDRILSHREGRVSPWRDLQPILDQELSRLPAKYRCAIVLCDLEGKTRKDAARQFGVPEGTLSGWLTRGRAMLAKRLARHGLAVTGGALAAVLAPGALAVGVPVSAVSTTIQAACLWAAGQVAPGVISAQVAALTEGVLKTMLLKNWPLAKLRVWHGGAESHLLHVRPRWATTRALSHAYTSTRSMAQASVVRRLSRTIARQASPMVVSFR